MENVTPFVATEVKREISLVPIDGRVEMRATWIGVVEKGRQLASHVGRMA